MSLGLHDLAAACPHSKQGWTIVGAWCADAALLWFAWWTTRNPM